MKWKDIKETLSTKAIGLMDKNANFAMNSAAQRFGTGNYGTPEWDKRNAHQQTCVDCRGDGPK